MVQEPNTALVIIDIQQDYFPGGAMELEGADAAGAKAGLVVEEFRKESLPVFHVRHLSIRPGATFFLPGTKFRWRSDTGAPGARRVSRGVERLLCKGNQRQ